MSFAPSNVVKSALVGVRGWLAFFCIILLVLQPFFVLVSYGATSAQMNQVKMWNPDVAEMFEPMMSATWAIAAVQVIFGMVAGLMLVMRAKGAVTVAKLFLLCAPVAAVHQFPLVPQGLPGKMEDAIMQGVIGDVIKTSLFCLIWFTYLCRSRRVRNTYGTASGAAAGAVLSAEQ